MAGETELERMVLKLLTDVEGYIQPLKEAVDASKDAAKEVENAGKIMEQLGDKLQSYGKKLSLYVTAPLVAMAGIATAAFGVQEAEEIKLRGILEANERQVESLFKDYATYASALQQVTVNGDEATLGMLRTAEALGVTGEAAKLAIKESMGLAAAVGMNARSAIRYTAMLAQGDTMMLQRYVPTLRKIEDQEERVAEAHRVLGNMFAVAEAEAATFTGQLKQLWNATGDLMEQFGAVVAEYLKPFVAFLKAIVLRLQTLHPTMKKVIVLVGATAAVLGPLLLTMGAVISSLGIMAWGWSHLGLVVTEALTKIRLAQQMFMALGGPMGWITLGITALIAGAVTLGLFLARIQKESRALDPIINAFRKAYETLKADLLPALKQLWERIQVDILPRIAQMSQEFSELAADLIAAFTPLLEAHLLAGIKSLGFVLEYAVVRPLHMAVTLSRMLSTNVGALGGLAAFIPGRGGRVFPPGYHHLAPKAREIHPIGEMARMVTEDGQKMMESLKLQRDTFGMTAKEAELYKLRINETFSREEREQIRQYIEEIAGLEDAAAVTKKLREETEQLATEQERSYRAFMDRGRAITEQYLTPLERAIKDQEELNQLLRFGAIDQLTYTRGLKAIEEKLGKAKPEQYVSPGVEAMRRGSIQEAILKQESFLAMRGGGGAETREEENRRNLAAISQNTSRESLEGAFKSALEGSQQERPGQVIEAGLTGVA